MSAPYRRNYQPAAEPPVYMGPPLKPQPKLSELDATRTPRPDTQPVSKPSPSIARFPERPFGTYRRNGHHMREVATKITAQIMRVLRDADRPLSNRSVADATGFSGTAVRQRLREHVDVRRVDRPIPLYWHVDNDEAMRQQLGLDPKDQEATP